MTDMLRPVLETLVVIPGMLIAYLPVQSYLKQRPLKLFLWLAPLLSVMAVMGGLLSYALSIPARWAVFAIALISMVIYTKTLCVCVWKSGSVFLAVIAIFSCMNSLSRAFDAIMTAAIDPTENTMWFCIGAGVLYNLLCWACAALVWHPSVHAAKDLIEDDQLPVTWKIFWVLPIVFIGLNQFMIPRYHDTLYTGRIMQGYIVISLALLFILGLFYAMFFIIANSMNKNVKLQQENQFLLMQQSRYDNLKSSIEEIRLARHDLRHHFTRLSAMAADGDLEKIKLYLSTVQNNIPNLEIHCSNNRAVDSVMGHYCALAHRDGIPILPRIDLPEKLPIDDMDICLILSNLLENALEASLRTTEANRQIRIDAYMHSEHLVLIQVQNTYSGKINENSGIFKSSKRKGNGIGIQSVRRIAEKNGGGSTFDYSNGIFTAKVMLRG